MNNNDWARFSEKTFGPEILGILGVFGPKIELFWVFLENDATNLSETWSVVESWYKLSIDVGHPYPKNLDYEILGIWSQINPSYLEWWGNPLINLNKVACSPYTRWLVHLTQGGLFTLHMSACIMEIFWYGLQFLSLKASAWFLRSTASAWFLRSTASNGIWDLLI